MKEANGFPVLSLISGLASKPLKGLNHSEPPNQGNFGGLKGGVVFSEFTDGIGVRVGVRWGFKGGLGLAQNLWSFLEDLRPVPGDQHESTTPQTPPASQLWRSLVSGGVYLTARHEHTAKIFDLQCICHTCARPSSNIPSYPG